jgi:hypothetical protein
MPPGLEEGRRRGVGFSIRDSTFRMGGSWTAAHFFNPTGPPRIIDIFDINYVK